MAAIGVLGCSDPPKTLTTFTCDPDATCERAGVASLTAAWPRHTIHHGLAGADGVQMADLDGDGLLDVVTPWEQASRVTVSLHPPADCACAVREPWPTIVLPGRIGGAEDAMFADVDGNGRLDVVAGGEDAQLMVYFAPDDPAELLTQLSWTMVEILPARDLQRWMQLAFADVDGDGRSDIVAGGRVAGAHVGYWTSATPRDGASWVWHPVGEVGCALSVIARDVDRDGDVDIVLSDRDPMSPVVREYLGARWLENPGPGAVGDWPAHVIYEAGGDLGYMRFIDVSDRGVIVGAASETTNRTESLATTDWLTWTPTEIPQPGNVGEYQDVERGDLDGDGLEDLAFSYSHAFGERSGVVWLRRDPVGGWTRGEISGPDGTKYDNLLLRDVDGDGDLDVVTSEQLSNTSDAADQLGLIWYENPFGMRAVQP
ncbi:MAG TPA: VCBS repeat-containing protein [Kofleriaceae bacterium]|nr:VCBS repeat-containing protein [Kofleriaceae bacterium]